MRVHSIHHHHRHYHNLQFLILLLLVATGFVSFVRSTGNPQEQMQIGLITASAYGLWGIFHHYYDRNLNWKIVVEYGAISLFGSAVLWTLLSYIS